MLVHVLRKMIGRVIRLEVGHPLRPTPEIFGGYLVGLYCGDSLAAVALHRDERVKPIGYRAEPAQVSPAPNPQAGLASGTSAPANTNAAPSNTGVIPGQPLQPLPPAPGTMAPSAPPPPMATQSNVKQVVEDLVRDFNIRWVVVKHIINVETDGSVKVNFMRAKIIDVTRPEQMFDNAPSEVKDNDGVVHIINEDVRKAYHAQTAALLHKKVDALDLPKDVSEQPSSDEILEVLNGIRTEIKMYLRRGGDSVFLMQKVIEKIDHLAGGNAPVVKEDAGKRSASHEGVTMPAPPASAYEVDPEGVKIKT